MESRKYQLKKQIIDAQKSNDSDLYSLLKSQWAHRYGVESLEELKTLDLGQPNQNLTDLNNQKIDTFVESSSKSDQPFHIKDENNQENEIKINKFESFKECNDDTFKAKSYEIVAKENDDKKTIYSHKESKIQPRVEALIPLPPKPKYSYLRKWLLGR